MRRHHSRAGLVRGRVVDANRPVDICPGLRAATGIQPVKLVKVRVWDARMWRDFVRYCAKFGIRWKVAGTADDKKERHVLGWYEVWGDAGWLQGLLRSRCVERWEDCLNIGAPRFWGG